MPPDVISIPPSNKQPHSDWVKMLPGLVVSLIALVAILSFVDFEQLAENFQKTDYRLLTLGFGLTITWLLVRAVVWRKLLGNQPRYWDTFFAINEGYLLNNLLPFRLGEAGRAFLLGRKPLVSTQTAGGDEIGQSNTLGFWRVLSSVVVERVLDMAFGVLILLITLPFVIEFSLARMAALAASIIVVIGLLLLYLMARNPQHILKLFDRLTSRISIVHRLGKNILPRLLEGLSVFTGWHRFVIVVGWIALNWLIGLGQYYLLLKAFLPDAPLLWAVFALGMVSVSFAIPSSPGNLGVLEWVIILALSFFAVDKDTALAYGITIHLLQVAGTTLFGLYGLAHEGETLLGVYRQIRTQKQF